MEVGDIGATGWNSTPPFLACLSENLKRQMSGVSMLGYVVDDAYAKRQQKDTYEGIFKQRFHIKLVKVAQKRVAPLRCQLFRVFISVEREIFAPFQHTKACYPILNKWDNGFSRFERIPNFLLDIIS